MEHSPHPAHRATRVGMTLTLCFCASIIEGLDLQSMGIAAPKLGPEFALSGLQSAWLRRGPVSGGAVAWCRG